MASESRNSRKKRRVKLNLSRARRSLQQQTEALVRAHTTLLMVLSQAGGEVTISQGTMQTVLQGIQLLNWQTLAKTDSEGTVIPGEFLVRVITQEGVQAVVDEAIAATVAPIDEDNFFAPDAEEPPPAFVMNPADDPNL